MVAGHEEHTDALRALKQAFRAQVESERQQRENREELSRQICEMAIRLTEYRAAQTLLLYVSRPSEVQTTHLLTTAWNQRKRVVVPSCQNGHLELFWIDTLEELAPRTLGILEPRSEVRASVERRIAVGELDFAIVPGLAFDRRGGRIGLGKGFYDRLLARCRTGVSLVGLAFECQVFDEVPMLFHDVFMDKVITEKAVYVRMEGRNREKATRI